MLVPTVYAAPNVPVNPKKPILFTVKITPGSLDRTLTDLANQFHWKLIWHLPFDYNWTGTVVLKGEGLPVILKQLLQHYPIQAAFYQGNRVLVIKARTLE